MAASAGAASTKLLVRTLVQLEMLTSGPGNSANTTPAKVSPTPLMLSRRSRFDRRSESLSIVSAMAANSLEYKLATCFPNFLWQLS
jgi:hypothetical protein